MADISRSDPALVTSAKPAPLSAPLLQEEGATVHTKFRRQRRVLIATLLVSDALMVALALLLAWYLRIGSGLLPYGVPADVPAYLRITLLAVILYLPIFAFSGLYKYNLLLGGPQEYGQVFRACSYGSVILVFASFLQHTTSFSRGWLLIAWALSILLVGGARFAWRRVFQALRRVRGWLVAPALIVGANEHGRAIARQLTGDQAGLRIVGFVDDYAPPGAQVVDGLKVLGTPRQLHHLALQHGVKQVIVLPNAVAWETFQEIMQQAGQANGYDLQLSPGFYEIMTGSVEVTNRAFVPLLTVKPARITGIDLVLKTALDFGLGAVLVLLAVPLMLPIALLLLLSGGRPILVRHAVLGMGGKSFRTLKFRAGPPTATDRNLDTDLPLETTSTSHTSSRLETFLYHSGLDKLPQLLDVMRGCMSLVGPRTVSVPVREAYNPWLPNLLTVKPGWTGAWAVGSVETLEEEMRLTLYYVRNWTIWLDLQVLFQTAKQVLARKRLSLNRQGDKEREVSFQ